jgi:AbrB family looped-hinge helix DNA binding protein
VEKKMSELVQVRKKSQITIPQSVRKTLGIEEGDYLDVRVKDGEIILKAKKLIDKDQAWFWTERWQQGEREADEDIKKGHTYQFEDVNEAITFLHEQSGEKPRKTAKD